MRSTEQWWPRRLTLPSRQWALAKVRLARGARRGPVGHSRNQQADSNAAILRLTHGRDVPNVCSRAFVWYDRLINRTRGLDRVGQSIRGEGRKRLIAATAECYRRSGAAATTIKDVCRQADASVGTVYHHFPRGLPDLEAALYLDALADYQAGLLDELQRHDSAEAGVKAVVLFHLEWIASNLSRAHFLLYFSPGWLTSDQAKSLRKMNERFVRAAEAWREPYLETGEIRRRSPILYGPLILGPAQQFGSLLIASGGDENHVASAVRAEGPELAEAAWSSVKGERG